MRFLVKICFIATLAAVGPVLAEDPMEGDGSLPVAEAAAPAAEILPGRVGDLSLRSGKVSFRAPGQTAWAEAELNQPIYAGAAVRTDPQALSEIRIGPNTVNISSNSEIEVIALRDQATQIALTHGRIGLHLRQIAEVESVEIDTPRGSVWLLDPGSYDVNAGAGDQPLQITAFEGSARVIRGDHDTRIGSGQMAVLAGSDPTGVSIETAVPDSFVEWCRARDYDETRLAATYYISTYMTGFAELDAAGIWKINSEYGPIWVPIAPEEWAPYRFGHWSWMAPWGWTWIDDQPWGFAPSHYGRWVLVDDHWAWVPGSFSARPLYAPAVVAFLGTPGVGLSSEEGATVAWFPLAPGEAYWPSYTRDVDYVRDLNRGNVQDVGTIRIPADGEPPLELFNEEFANRQYATVVPRSVFINGRPVAPARMTLPEHRLQNAPVLMASPQIAPASVQRVVHAVPTASTPASRGALKTARTGSTKSIRAALMSPQGRAQPVVIRGAHLRAPSYAGVTRGRQMIVLQLAHPRSGTERRARR
jgi:hypothetical protein